MTGDSEPKYREMFFTAGRVMNIKLPPRRCFLHPWLSEQTITLITGFRGVGKTWFGLGIAKSISTGKAFGPWECKDIARVMYIDGELPLMDMQDRIRGMGLDIDNQNLVFYLDSIAEMNDFARPNLGNEEWREKMLTILTKEKFDVVIYDNISALTPGTEENKAEQWDPIAEFIKTCRHRGVSSILFHHPGKNGDQRGTSKREDIISNSIVLRKPVNYLQDEGARFEVDFTKQRISHADLKYITTRECQLIQDASGLYSYKWLEPQKETSTLILRMFSEGVLQKDIPEHTGISKGHVSKTKNKLIEQKLLKPKGNELILTPTGAEYLMKNDPTFGATAW